MTRLTKYEAKHIDLNLIDNGDLENISSTNSDTAEGFDTFYSTSGAAPLFRMNTGLDTGTTYEVRPVSGQNMFKINGDGSTVVTAGMRSQFRIPITGASTYNYRVWAKAWATTGYLYGKIEWYGTTGNLISSDVTGNIYGYSDWTRLTLSTSAPTAAEHARVSVETSSEVNGIFWVDQLSVALDLKNYITSAEYTTLCNSEVGDGKEISTTEFNDAVKTASRIVERDTGRVWYPKDESYLLIQSAVAFLTLYLIKSGHYGDMPEPAIKMEGATTDWNLARYEFFKNKAMRTNGLVSVDPMKSTGNPYW